MYKFNSFTDKATSALNLAVLSAQELGHTYIGSEHILLGILSEDECIAFNALKECGIEKGVYISVLIDSIPIGNETKLNISDFTPRSKKIIANSTKNKKYIGRDLIGSDILLESILREKSSLAVRIVEKLGLDYDLLRIKLKKYAYLEYLSYSKKTTTSSKFLENYGVDLNNKAINGRIDPLICREKEINRLIRVLSRRNKNNPCLIGDPGVGKTAIVEGLALKIVKKDIPQHLQNKKIISLNLTYMVAGTRYRGDFEERVKNLLKEVKKDKNIILFIDELHSIIGAGSAEGSPDIANILKPSLSNGDLQVIGATTVPEYRKYIAKDMALERRFSPIEVNEPSFNESVEMIEGLKAQYEKFHNINISSEAVKSAVNLSKRYITDRFLPDKAIDLIDEASSKVKLDSVKNRSEKLKILNENLNNISLNKTKALEKNEFDIFFSLDNEAKDDKAYLEKLNCFDDFPIEVSIENDNEIKPTLKPYHIANIVSSKTGIPIEEITMEESNKLKFLEENLNKNIIGQEYAVSMVANALKRGRSGIRDTNHPIGSFIFLGPTGLGKTQLCKVLSEYMFGKTNSLIRFDMSEFMEKHSVSRLIGSPPGYKDCDKGGELTEAINRKPYSIVLFDEIEKAHPDILNIFLQILDDGYLNDSSGRKIDFKNTVIIMTSNIGAKIISNDNTAIGFNDTTAEEIKKRQEVIGKLKKAFNPEFLNRIDEIIVFNRLSKYDIEKIVNLLLCELKDRLSENKIELEFSQRLIKQIANKKRDENYGARQLKRIIQKDIENKLADKILETPSKSRRKFYCDFDKKLIIKELSIAHSM